MQDSFKMKSQTPDPETIIKFGKHKGQTFIHVYENDSNYVNWAKSIPNPKGELIDFLKFVSNHEMCMNLPIEEKYSGYKQTNSNKFSKNQSFYDHDPSTPKSPGLESQSIYLKSDSSFTKTDSFNKKVKLYDDPTPGDVSFFKDPDYKFEKDKLSPSLRHILDKLEDDFIEPGSEGGVKLDGLLALVLFSEDEFYLSYSKCVNNTGWWTPNIPSDISSIVSKLGLTTHNRMLGRSKCVTYKAGDYSTVLKALRAGIQNKNNIEPVPNFILRTFPEFFIFSRESEVEDKTRQVLQGSQDHYTLTHMNKMQKMIGDILWDKLMPFQRDGVLFGLGRNGRVLIGDEMGLGKTLQALAISAFYIEDWPLLIICPSSIRFQWLEQCLTWLPHLVKENEILLVKTSKQLEGYIVNDSPKRVSKKKRKNKSTELNFNEFSIDAENNSGKSKGNKSKSKNKRERNDLDFNDEEDGYLYSHDLVDEDEFNPESKENGEYKVKNENNRSGDYESLNGLYEDTNGVHLFEPEKEYMDSNKSKEENKIKRNQIKKERNESRDKEKGDDDEDEENSKDYKVKSEKSENEEYLEGREEKEGKVKRENGQYDLYLGCYKIVIVSYDLLVRMKELDGFKAVICDESHYLKSRSSQRSRRIVPMLKEAKRTVLLSGTPAVNFPAELYQQLSSIIPAFSCYSVFVERYCKKKFNIFSKKMEYTDSKHAHELHLFLIKTVMIRRLKYEVMKELPSKIRSKIPIEVCDKVVKMTSMMQDQYREFVTSNLTGESNKSLGGKKGADEKGPQTNLDNFVVKKESGEEGQELVNLGDYKLDGDGTGINNGGSKDLDCIDSTLGTGESDLEEIRKEIFDKFGGEWEVKLKRKGKSKRKDGKEDKNKGRSNENNKEGRESRKDKDNKYSTIGSYYNSNANTNTDTTGVGSGNTGPQGGNNFGEDDNQENKEGQEEEGEEMPRMQRLFFMTGEAKIKGVCKYIEEILENNDKFIIFAHHIFMLDAIEETLKAKKVTYIRIDGSTNVNARARMVQDFQRSAKKVNEVPGYSDYHCYSPDKLKSSDSSIYRSESRNYENNREGKETRKEVRVALLSITACGVGLNLTASSTVIFAELFWVPGKLLQAEDRVHRIGTEFRSINIHYLIAQNSIDELIWKVVNNKQMSLTATLDGAVSSIAISGSNKKK